MSIFQGIKNNGNVSLIKKVMVIFAIIISLFLNVFSNIPLFAQNNLNYFLEKAFENNPAIRSCRNDIKINSLDRQLVMSQYSSHQVSLTGNYLIVPYFNSNGKIISATPSPDAIGYDEAITNGGQYSFLLNIEKNLFNSNLIDAYQKEFDVSTDKTNYDIIAAKHQIDNDVTAQYLKCRQQLMLLDINKEIIKSIEDELSVIKTLIENGMSKQTDYLQLKVEADNQAINSKIILSSYFSELVQLNKLTGISDTNFKNLEPVELILTERRIESNSYLQFRLDSLKVLSSQSAFESKYNPNLSVFANVGLNAVQLFNMQRKFGMSAGVNFSWIMFDGGQKSLNSQKSDVSLMTVDYNRSNFIINRENQLNISAKQIELNRQMLLTINTQIITYQSLLKALNVQLSNGQLSVIDYLTTLRNFYELRKTEVITKINLQLSINEFNNWNW